MKIFKIHLAAAVLFYFVLQISANPPPKCPSTQSNLASAPKPGETVGCGKQAVEPNIGPRTRIIGGTEAKAHSWPWQISMQFNGSQWCGGTLLRVSDDVEESDIVLSAAHCIIKEGKMLDPTAFHIVLGNHAHGQNESGEVSIPVDKVQVHGSYFADNLNGVFHHDLALFKLKCPVKFTDTIRPICLPQFNERANLGSSCVATGWGRQAKFAQDYPDKLQQTEMTMRPWAECESAWTSVKFMKKTMLCAAKEDWSANTCTADSGGPLICKIGDKWTQYGSVSYGRLIGCMQKGVGNVFTRQTAFKPWIEWATRKLTNVRF